MTAARTGGGTAGTGFVIGNDLTTFDNETISGGAVTAYNSAGTPVNLQLRWAKTDSSSLGSPHQDTWNLFYQTDPSATGTQVAWVNVGTNFTFNSDGVVVESIGFRHHHSRCDRERSIAWKPDDEFRLRRVDAIRQHRRHRDRQHHHAERLRRRPASVGRHQQQRPRGRNVFERAEPRSRLGHAVAFQRHQLPARRSTAVPMP